MEENQENKKKKVKPGSFQSLGLEQEILNGLSRMGYKEPTPIQRKTLPLVIAGLDVVCMARTGSGKTCIFLLPMLQKLKSHSNLGIRGIVLSPTRELAAQTYKFAKDMARFTDLRIVNIFGGDSIEAQFDALASKPDVLIATPGRLMHHIREISTFKLKSVKYLVFDEADRLFEMGFAEQLNEIVRECPKERQTLLFSATLPKLIVQFSRAGLKDPQLIRLDTDVKMSDELRLAFFTVRSNEKIAALLYLVRRVIPNDQQTIIFTATRHHSELLHAIFQRIEISSTMIYGSMDQDARSANLKDFRQGRVNYLIVTDLAARGIDVPLLNNVINFHFPPSPKLFVHRCGRAARQGRIGFAFSLVEPDELGYMMDSYRFLNKKIDTGYPTIDNSEGRDETESIYTFSSMTPEMVHIGLLPQDAIDEEQDFVKRLLHEDDTFSTMNRISDNGMKQYKRTRSEATREGIKEAKKLVKSNLITTIHPLIAGSDPAHCNKDILAKANFIRMLQTFRPNQTVFETGIGTGSTAYFAAGSGEASKAKHKQAADTMKALRESTASALERNKKSKLIVQDKEDSDDESENLSNFDEDIDDEVDEFPDAESENEHDIEDIDDEIKQSIELDAPELDKKKRLSAAEKKYLKKHGSLNGFMNKKGSQDFNKTQDSKFYMSYGNENTSESFAEETLQPLSNLRSSESFGASVIDKSMQDFALDDDAARKKKISRWDPKKKKFVKQTLNEMAVARKSGLKRMRSESGVSVTLSSKAQGEMYEQWKKKRKIEISDDNEDQNIDYRKRPNVRVNMNVKSEIRTKDEVRKLVKKRDDMKLKNMEKGKRRKIENNLRQKKNAKNNNKSK